MGKSRTLMGHFEANNGKTSTSIGNFEKITEKDRGIAKNLIKHRNKCILIESLLYVLM